MNNTVLTCGSSELTLIKGSLARALYVVPWLEGLGPWSYATGGILSVRGNAVFPFPEGLDMPFKLPR